MLHAGQALDVSVARFGSDQHASVVILFDQATELIESVGNDIEHTAGQPDRNLLVEPRDDRALSKLALTCIGHDLAGHYLHQRRLALAVAADQAHPLTAFDAEFQRLEKRCAAEGKADVLQPEQRHGIGSGSALGCRKASRQRIVSTLRLRLC